MKITHRGVTRCASPWSLTKQKNAHPPHSLYYFNITQGGDRCSATTAKIKNFRRRKGIIQKAANLIYILRLGAAWIPCQIHGHGVDFAHAGAESAMPRPCQFGKKRRTTPCRPHGFGMGPCHGMDALMNTSALFLGFPALFLGFLRYLWIWHAPMAWHRFHAMRRPCHAIPMRRPCHASPCPCHPGKKPPMPCHAHAMPNTIIYMVIDNPYIQYVKERAQVNH